MNRVLVRFLLWLLIAALPLQGIAAAVKTCCGQTHAASAQAQAHHGGDCAEAGAKVHDQCTGASCGACASCCLGVAALPAPLVFIPVFFATPAIESAPATPVSGFIPGGLERPPRQFSA